MEEKENSHSGSLGNSENGSPPDPLNNISSSQVMVGDRSFGAALTTATAAMTISTTPGSGGGSGDFLGKKKRGRPRKYDADGNLRVTPSSYNKESLNLSSSSSPFSPCEFSSSKRGRGKPSGSSNWQLLASFGEVFANTAGGDFTPHVVTINAGEDVVEKIMNFSQKGPRGICVLSANGAVSNVTIRQPGSTGGFLTYEGRFEILSLSGSYTVTETSTGVRSRTGGLSVSLAGPDGRVVGGGLAGLLTAASAIQIVIGSFMPNGFKAHKKKHTVVPSPVAPNTVTAATPISITQTRSDTDNCLIDSSPMPGPEGGEAESESGAEERQNLNFPNQNAAAWNGTTTPPSPIQRPSPDINVSVTCGE